MNIYLYMCIYIYNLSIQGASSGSYCHDKWKPFFSHNCWIFSIGDELGDTALPMDILDTTIISSNFWPSIQVAFIAQSTMDTCNENIY